MKITLQQHYNDTKDKFKLNLLAGKDGMNNKAMRLYYMEDIMISNVNEINREISPSFSIKHTDDKLVVLNE